MSFARLLWRGLAAGMIAGCAAGMFAFAFAEPTVDRAIRFEESHAAAPADSAHTAADEEVVSRRGQRVGLVVGTTIVGGALGCLFTLVLAGAGDREAGWPQVAGTAGAMFVGLVLVPFLRYPANPPGVGDPETIDLRTRLYLGAVVLGVTAVLGAWRLLRWLQARGVPAAVRQSGVVASFAVVVGIGYAVLPDNPDPVPVPATLLWDFRLRSLAVLVVLWAGLAAGFGVLTERARQTPQ